VIVALAVIAGISLTATAVSWWNGRRTAEVEAEIERLENELASIYAADAKERRALIVKYLESLESLISLEVSSRDAIATELTTSHAKAKKILKSRFGSKEKDSFLQLVLELELALSRINAERSYLQYLQRSVESGKTGDIEDLPTPASLALPIDYPKEGGLVHFDAKPPALLYGYKIEVQDWSEELGGRSFLHGVDHNRKRAKLSVARAALLEADLTEGGGAMLAKVGARRHDGVHLEYSGNHLVLPYQSRDLGSYTPETVVEVYPELWTIEEISRSGPDNPLFVRTTPRIEGSNGSWSPILLSVEEEKLPSLIKAYEAIGGASSQAGWRLYLTDSRICFTLSKVTLVTIPDYESSSFILDEVRFGSVNPEVSLRFDAEFCAYIPGSDDQPTSDDKSLFVPFLRAIHSEIGSQKNMLIQRKTALRLRKLSLIYQDQEEFLQSDTSVDFVKLWIEHGGRKVAGLLSVSEIPDWVDQLAFARYGGRARAVGNSVIWDLRKFEWIDRELGTCRIEVDVSEEATIKDINPSGITRIELSGEGSQQQTLSRSLESAILGKYTSGAVHSALMGLSGEPVENVNLGRDQVEAVLLSDEPVVAVWGPPGTGKTTLLVRWLSTLFPQDRKETWPSILVTAPTHVAVTKLVSDLLDKLPFLAEEVVRYGAADRVLGTSLEGVWHENLVSSLFEDRDLPEELTSSAQRWKSLLQTRKGREAATQWLIGSRRIHAVTCVGMARKDYGLSSRSFDIAIVDEAGKAFGAELLIPASVARRVIMVGDHNQLPPTVTSEMLNEDVGYRLPLNEVETLLRENMFKSIFDQLPSSSKGMLTRQYRMHKDIGDVVSALFYEGRLESARSGGNWDVTSKRVVFVDFSKVRSYKHRRSSGSSSIENATERAALRSLLKRMSVSSASKYGILVVCPYESQRSLVSEEIAAADYNLNISVSTVDAVQGGEADIVVLLMTRSSGRTEFLLDKNRLNVALSRARESVLILGHAGCLCQTNESPMSKLLSLGMYRGTLDVVELSEKANFRKDLSEKLVGLS